MGGLGNGRRGGRSPPLMIGALIACILVLGFNYWVSSSRNLELQTKLYELEGQIRRGAAERGAAEVKRSECQEEIRRQKEQISRMESLYKRQLEGAQNICSQQKSTLEQQLLSNSKTIQGINGQLTQQNDDRVRMQKEFHSCQVSLNTLNKKLTYDMTQCNTQILSQKELCDERVAAAKLEVQKKMEKLNPAPAVSLQAGVVNAVVKDAPKILGVDTNKTSAVFQPKENVPTEVATNESVVDKGLDAPVILPSATDPPRLDSKSKPVAATVKQESLLPPEGAARAEEAAPTFSQFVKENVTEGKEVIAKDDPEKDAKPAETDLVRKGAGVQPQKADETAGGHKTEGPEDYAADEEIVGEDNLKKPEQIKEPEDLDKEMEEELADYNGDEENEGEFEADKQAALAQI